MEQVEVAGALSVQKLAEALNEAMEAISRLRQQLEHLAESRREMSSGQLDELLGLDVTHDYNTRSS